MELLKKKKKRDKTSTQDMLEKSQEGKSKETQVKEEEKKNIISVEEEGESNEAQVKKEEKNIISVEGYRKNKILDLMSVPEFNTSETLQPPSSDLSLFETKKLAELYLKENKYNIEEILEYDDTNKDVQKKYLSLIIKELNINDKIDKKNIILEKIQKCGIILDKDVYEEEIKKIDDENLKNNLAYIDYKNSIINTLEYIKNNKKGNASEAREKLNIKKIFIFNHESSLGNNNYYFYGFARQLSLKLEEIFKYYKFYLYVIDINLEYLKKDFSNLSENEIYIFKYLKFILNDTKSITKKSIYNEIKNFIEGNKISKIDELSNAIKTRNDKEVESDSEMKDNIYYNINYKEGLIEYIINEETKIDRKFYNKEEIKYYKSDIFNQDIIELIKTVPLENFESKIFRKILPERKYSFAFYKDIKDIIFSILIEILKSNAAKLFFKDHYENKYNKNNQIIKYHFDKKDVIEEIINRIEFYPIFCSSTKANTDPSDLTIIINSIPGEFSPDEEINYFNKNILQIGRIVVFSIHEVLVHFLRRYYSYITNGIIKMDTNEDALINTSPEGGSFVERNFLGFKTESRLYLKDALFFFFYKDNYDNYPIIKEGKELTEDNLKEIVKNNPKIFYFIDLEGQAVKGEDKIIKNIHDIGGKNIKEEKEEKEKKEEKKEKTKTEKGKKRKDNKKKKDEKKLNQNDKITIKNYFNFLNPVKNKFPSIVSCGFRRGEIFIEL